MVLKSESDSEHSEHERVVLRMVTVFAYIGAWRDYVVDGAKNRPIDVDRR